MTTPPLPIHPTLIVPGPITEGLANGLYTRWGGVIRETENGRIVKHLVEPPSFTRELMRQPAQFSPPAAQVPDLSGLMNLTQIGAAASVLNLGVSVAGFAYMSYKLNQVQSAVADLKQAVDDGFAQVNDRLDVLKRQLGYVILLAEQGRAERAALSEAIAGVQRLFLVDALSDLQAHLDELDRFGMGDARDAMRTAGRVRRTMQNQVEHTSPNPSSHALLLGGVTMQAWAAATAAETNLLLRTGRSAEAIQVVAPTASTFRQAARRWADELLRRVAADAASEDYGPEQLQTVYRFNTPRFSGTVLPERVARIARLRSSEYDPSSAQARSATDEAELELQMARSASIGDDWLKRQLAYADFLDGFSELADRLDSLHAFAQQCHALGVKDSKELLPSDDAEPGLYLLDAVSEETR